MFKQPQTPYCGFIRDENDYLHVVRSAARVLVSGPTEIGKSRRIRCRQRCCGAALVFVSSKDTELQLLSARRCFGPSALIDLRPDYDADYFGVDNLAFDPTTLITTPDQAVTAANTMMQMSAVGLGSGSRPGPRCPGSGRPTPRPPLSAMLYAASPMGNNKGMDWVLMAVDNMTKLDPNADPTLWKEPGWSTAAQIVRHLPLFSNALLRTLTWTPASATASP